MACYIEVEPLSSYAAAEEKKIPSISILQPIQNALHATARFMSVVYPFVRLLWVLTSALSRAGSCRCASAVSRGGDSQPRSMIRLLPSSGIVVNKNTGLIRLVCVKVAPYLCPFIGNCRFAARFRSRLKAVAHAACRPPPPPALVQIPPPAPRLLRSHCIDHNERHGLVVALSRVGVQPGVSCCRSWKFTAIWVVPSSWAFSCSPLEKTTVSHNLSLAGLAFEVHL